MKDSGTLFADSVPKSQDDKDDIESAYKIEANALKATLSTSEEKDFQSYLINP